MSSPKSITAQLKWTLHKFIRFFIDKGSNKYEQRTS